MNQKSVLKKVLAYIKKYNIYMILSIIAATITVVSTLYFPILTGDAVDMIIGKTLFIPPNASATTAYSPSASSAKLSIPIRTDDLDINVFIVTDFPAPDLANITML